MAKQTRPQARGFTFGKAARGTACSTGEPSRAIADGLYACTLLMVLVAMMVAGKAQDVPAEAVVAMDPAAAIKHTKPRVKVRQAIPSRPWTH